MLGRTFDVNSSVISHLFNFSSSEIFWNWKKSFNIHFNNVIKLMDSKMPGGNGHLSDNLRINQIVYLGSHNCAMAKCYGWIYAQ